MRSPYRVALDWLWSWRAMFVPLVLVVGSVAVLLWAAAVERAIRVRCENAGGIYVDSEVCVTAPGLRRIHP